MGGKAGYALKRVLVEESGRVKFDLKHHQQKSLQTDRVLLAIGDKVDAGLVRLIFYLCATVGMSEADIARQLNWSCYPGKTGLYPWRAESVRKVLRNEKYAGTALYGRRCTDIRTFHRMNNPQSKWVRAPDAIEPIVPKATFDAAQRVMASHHRHYWTDEEMLEVLRRIQFAHGEVTSALLGVEPRAPGSVLYVNHFGSLADACTAAGLAPSERLERSKFIIANRRRAKIQILRRLEELYRRVGIDLIWVRNSRRALVPGGLTISVRTTHPWLGGHCRVPTWFVGPDHRVSPDFSLIGRLDGNGEQLLDYVLFPESDSRRVYIRSTGSSEPDWLAKYLCETLEEAFRRLEVARLTQPSKPFGAVGINLAKRRRKVLHIRKRVEMPGVVEYRQE